MNQIRIFLIDYPGSMTSSIFGLRDLFNISNQFIQKGKDAKELVPVIVEPNNIELHQLDTSDIVILPPSLEDLDHFTPSKKFLANLRYHQNSGGLICSVCAGANLLAQAGILDNKLATTHWVFESEFERLYPNVKINTHKVVVDQAGVITAGGLLSWIDLGLTIIARIYDQKVMRDVARYFYAPALPRESRGYIPFYPKITTDDPQIAKVQKHLHQNVSKNIQISNLASLYALSERTFHRRFHTATAHTPFVYLQKLRVQKACDYLEVQWLSVAQLAEYVGYKDVGAFTKIFKRHTGLTPKSFYQKTQ